MDSLTEAARVRWSVEESYEYCRNLARSHYENFTVGSWFLPREKRPHVYAVYAFCRFVDDLGDESQGDRLGLLDWWEEELRSCYASRPSHPITVALAETIQRFHIPQEPFLKLIEANRMDQRAHRHRTYEDLLRYCDHSANPVGRLFLYLFGYGDEERQRLADATCTALQLTNFWQDVRRDMDTGRVYIPQEDMERFGYTEERLQAGVADESFRDMMRFQVDRARDLFDRGAGLVDMVDGAVRLDIALFTLGGLHILNAIERQGYDVLRSRPPLSKFARERLVLTTATKMKLGRKSENHANGIDLRRETFMDRELDQAYAYCRSITRERAKNFYYAFITLPTAKRRAIYAAYAFCRLCDDAVDDVTDVDEKLRLLAEQREGLARTYAGAPEGRVFVALQDVISAYNIPREYLEEVINGVEMDISKARYPTFEELREYCYRVASAVGLICIEIFGYNDPSAREHAVELGLAMQLTNILRDVEEDVARDRVYIPQEDLERFGCSEEDIFLGRVTDNFRDLMRFQVERARERFRMGKRLLPLLSPSSRACPAMLHNTYSRLLDRIEASGYKVFGNRVGLSAGEKLAMVARLWLNGIAARAAGK